jgi:hypothetical protein
MHHILRCAGDEPIDQGCLRALARRAPGGPSKAEPGAAAEPP